MKPLKLDEVWRILPPVDELRPVLDLLAAHSSPDPDRTWSASGELGTVGDRVVPGTVLAGSEEALAREIQEHLAAVYDALGKALHALARGDGPAAAEAFLGIAALEEDRHRPDRTEAYARSAWLAARDARNRVPAALALRRWARALRSQGKLAEALERYREGFQAARDAGDPRGAAEAAVGAGNVLEEQGRWGDSEEWYRRALEILGSPQDPPVPERWHALVNLHIVLRSQGRLQESLPYLDQAEAVARSVGEPGAGVFFENARGQLALVRGDPRRAVSHFRTALASAPAGSPRVTVRLNLAEALLAEGRLLDAAESAREAELEALSSGAVPRLPEVYRLLGRVAAAGENPDAFVLFERALEIIRERGLPALEEARTLQAYAEAEVRRGEEEAGRALHDRAMTFYKELGIEHPRHPWTEFFGGAGSPPETDPSNPTGGEHA